MSTRSYARSEELYAAACDVLPGGASSNFRLGGQPVPLFFERAEGARDGPGGDPRGAGAHRPRQDRQVRAAEEALHALH